jgi:hypothetical protein
MMHGFSPCHLGKINVVIDHFFFCRNQQHVHLVGVAFILTQNLKIQIYIGYIKRYVLLRFKTDGFLKLLFRHGLNINFFYDNRIATNGKGNIMPFIP